MTMITDATLITDAIGLLVGLGLLALAVYALRDFPGGR